MLVHQNTKPLLLLDVDGVLCPFDCPQGYQPVDEDEVGHPGLYIAKANAKALQRWTHSYRLIWATTWEEEANEVMSGLHGIGPLPVIRFTKMREGVETMKLPSVEEYVTTNPIAWLDDDLREDAFAWGEARDVPTLLVKPDPSKGLTEEHIEMVDFFAKYWNDPTEPIPDLAA